MRQQQTPLDELLQERGLTVADLSRAAGLTYPRVWRAVSGLQCSRQTARILADVLEADFQRVYSCRPAPAASAQ